MTSDRKTKVLHVKILDSRFGKHSINKFSDEAKKNDDREIDLVDFDFGTSELEKYEAAGNYSKLFEILKTYSENNDDKAFLVVKNKSTGNFLQFAKGEKTNFLLDIPNNIDTVTKIVIGFFVEVYLLPPNFKFKISKGNF